jgi:ribosomal protein S18 acetylase RimI-like enzyme
VPVISIRPATTEDDGALRRIDVETWSPAVTPAPARADDAPFFDERSTPDDVVVAELDGAVVGYALVHQVIGLPSHAHVLELGIAVLPGHQGAGLGRALLGAAVESARSRGARKLSLRVLGGNARARHLYESCGFIVEGVLRGEFHLDGEDVDDVLMALRLEQQGPQGHLAGS